MKKPYNIEGELMTRDDFFLKLDELSQGDSKDVLMARKLWEDLSPKQKDDYFVWLEETGMGDVDEDGNFMTKKGYKENFNYLLYEQYEDELKESKNSNNNNLKSKKMTKKETVVTLLRKNGFNPELARYKAEEKKTGKRTGIAFSGSEQLRNSKLPSAVFARAVQKASKSKKEAEFWKLPESDSRIKDLIAATKAAGSDLASKTWSPKVAKAINLLLAIRGESARGGARSLPKDEVDSLLGKL